MFVHGLVLKYPFTNQFTGLMTYNKPFCLKEIGTDSNQNMYEELFEKRILCHVITLKSKHVVHSFI